MFDVYEVEERKKREREKERERRVIISSSCVR